MAAGASVERQSAKASRHAGLFIVLSSIRGSERRPGRALVLADADDGYQALKALLPPKEKRGLVLIDPPYESQLEEFDTALHALRDSLARWPQGTYVLWYPIKLRRSLQPQSVAQMIRVLNDTRRNNRIYIRLLNGRPGALFFDAEDRLINVFAFDIAEGRK